MPINVNDTVTMIQAMERTFTPSSFLLDYFFPNEAEPTPSAYVQMEYRKGGRLLAPFIVSGSKGINMARSDSKMNLYKPPLLGPRRVLSADDLESRGFGETIYSTTTPEQREMIIRAKDLAELQDMITRRKSWMAAQLLVNGKFDVAGYADDGKIAKVDTVSFPEWKQKLILSGTDTWDNAAAKIYDVLSEASLTVQQNAGIVPTIAIAGKNISKYLLNNTQIKDWLMMPRADTFSLLSITPQIQSPNLIRIGYIQSLNLDLYQYSEVFQDTETLDTDGNPTLKPYIPDDAVVMAVPKRGKQLYGAVTLVENKQHVTYAAKYVPKYSANEDDNVTALTTYSRVVLCPEFVDDWYTIITKS